MNLQSIVSSATSLANKALDRTWQVYRSTLFGSHGLLHFTRSGYIAHSRDFDSLDMDLSATTIVLTGANSGIGKATLYALVRRGAHVIMVCRNPARGAIVRDAILSEFQGSKVSLEIVDLAKPVEITAFVKRLSKYPPVNVLINNAGVLLPIREETEDHLEATFATNTLGVYHLTQLMIPLLASHGRVITVSSGGQYNVPLSTLDLQSSQSYDGSLAYAQTKRAEVELTRYWATKYPQLAFYSMHPGWVRTPGLEGSLPLFYKTMDSYLRSPEQGCDSVVWAALSNQVLALENGAFIFDRQQVSPHLTFGKTEVGPEVVEQLVQHCDEILKKLLK